MIPRCEMCDSILLRTRSTRPASHQHNTASRPIRCTPVSQVRSTRPTTAALKEE